ncbi:substrate-binding domain-containing protein [Methylobacterium radiodurans]|uniref:ABC transporter substrate-binding protein n=1 Tax=Methylobacterium radiodurans TaxID=2202828 RepID=A0A2U8VWE7_9HYPH|nr:substrate-binding domain-containing protein [Methylobacterium radiodurans]AWN37611.1 hypothetical protein DK427_19325 [Methylobacterium radiodurans]
MTATSTTAAELTVMISGGFALAYQEVVPAFERATGIAVTTLSGASQGTGPKTIRAQLDRGTHVDVVILSNEGLHALVEAGLIVEGSPVELATAPLAAAVRAGTRRPDIGSVEALTRTLLEARLVVMPGSTSGLFILNEVLPRLGIAGTVRSKVFPRGTESAAALAAGEADIALGPISELVNIAGIEPVGPLPDAVQLVQTFTAAITRSSRDPEAAALLTGFLGSDQTTAAIQAMGMEPVRDRAAP